MKGTSFIIFLVILFISVGQNGADAQVQDNGVYIVYMGGAPNKDYHDPLLSSLLKRNKSAVVRTYKHGFLGFAARLSKQDAHEMAKHPSVVSVFPDPVLHLHTTHSWDFLHLQTSLLIDSRDPSPSSKGLSDSIIGTLDTGIWPEAESFNDKGIGQVPLRWKGTCVDGRDLNSTNCNRKLIGARYYTDPEDTDPTLRTARDTIGHGTHVASTAAGASIANASYYGLASGTARGGSPSSRLAVYRVCTTIGCRGSAILAAFDDAIADGVDVLSLSLGSAAFFAPGFDRDPIAIGAFHAVQKGITVVCSAGNDGPASETVVNVAPWILSVGATTIDRDLESDVVLGNNKVIKGESINLANIQKDPIYPLISGSSVKSNSSSEDDARKCYPGSLEKEKIKGKIVICQDADSTYSWREKRDDVKSGGGVGIILVNDKIRLVAPNSGTFPMTVISSKDAQDILEYINSTRNPVATIMPTVTVLEYKPAPSVAYFSGRGPAYSTPNILKPDVAAPGVNILAAWIANDSDAPRYYFLSGTSMSCPHVSGIAAAIKSQYPTWSPAAVRSAIMTAAIQTNNMNEPMTIHTGEVATPYDYGAGEVHPTKSLQPGLVYETDPIEYLQFLCYYGYDISSIKLISPVLPVGFSCPKDAGKDMISNINYPSIAISSNVTTSSAPVNVTRTVTNVGSEDETTYTVSVDAPEGLDVKVVPDTLRFTKSNSKLSFQVSFSSSSVASVKRNVFGIITWTNGKYQVKSPFVVSKSA